MFARRHKPGWLKRLCHAIWPRTGFRRALRYIGHRVMRLSGSPYAIAAGFACGAGISFTPFLGFHFLLAGLWAWAIRGNIIASALGTVVGNPSTFPFIFGWIYFLGATLLGKQNTHTSFAETDLSLDTLLADPWGIFLPMSLGGVLTALVAWCVFFFPLRRLVAGYQKVRHGRLSSARHREKERRKKRADAEKAALEETSETEKADESSRRESA